VNKFVKGDLVLVDEEAQNSYGKIPLIVGQSHRLAGKRAIFLLTKDLFYAKILGETGTEMVEKVFLRLIVPVAPF
tara:strand:- start:385 stop:609 length:225 start_codon:yes stop_codon:yes gene_type:complete